MTKLQRGDMPGKWILGWGAGGRGRGYPIERAEGGEERVEPQLVKEPPPPPHSVGGRGRDGKENS